MPRKQQLPWSVHHVSLQQPHLEAAIHWHNGLRACCAPVHISFSTYLYLFGSGGGHQAAARQLPPTHQSEAVRAAAAAVRDAASSEPPRPIVRNRRIERVDPPAWDAAALPFDYPVSCSSAATCLL